jgi:hypothetical protein
LQLLKSADPEIPGMLRFLVLSEGSLWIDLPSDGLPLECFAGRGPIVESSLLEIEIESAAVVALRQFAWAIGRPVHRIISDRERRIDRRGNDQYP